MFITWDAQSLRLWDIVCPWSLFVLFQYQSIIDGILRISWWVLTRTAGWKWGCKDIVKWNWTIVHVDLDGQFYLGPSRVLLFIVEGFYNLRIYDAAQWNGNFQVGTSFVSSTMASNLPIIPVPPSIAQTSPQYLCRPNTLHSARNPQPIARLPLQLQGFGHVLGQWLHCSVINLYQFASQLVSLRYSDSMWSLCDVMPEIMMITSLLV